MNISKKKHNDKKNQKILFSFIFLSKIKWVIYFIFVFVALNTWVKFTIIIQFFFIWYYFYYKIFEFWLAKSTKNFGKTTTFWRYYKIILFHSIFFLFKKINSLYFTLKSKNIILKCREKQKTKVLKSRKHSKKYIRKNKELKKTWILCFKYF